MCPAYSSCLGRPTPDAPKKDEKPHLAVGLFRFLFASSAVLLVLLATLLLLLLLLAGLLLSAALLLTTLLLLARLLVRIHFTSSPILI
jgi:hypothetical protein